MRPDVDRPDVDRPDVDRPDVDLPGVDQPDGVLQRAAAGEASDQNDPYDYDSDDTSDRGDEIAGAPRTLEQKKKLRIKRRDRYMRVRRASPLGVLDPRGGTRRLIAQLRNTPGM